MQGDPQVIQVLGEEGKENVGWLPRTYRMCKYGSRQETNRGIEYVIQDFRSLKPLLLVSMG